MNINKLLTAPVNAPRGRAASVRYDTNSPRLLEARLQYQKVAPKRKDVVDHVLDTMRALGLKCLHFTIDASKLPKDEYGYLVFDAATLGNDVRSSINLTYVEDGRDIYPLCVALGTNDLNTIFPDSVDDYRKSYKYKNSYTGKIECAWSCPTKGIIAHQLGLKFSNLIDLFPLSGIEDSVLTPRQVEQCIGESIASRFPLVDRYSHCYPL